LDRSIEELGFLDACLCAFDQMPDDPTLPSIHPQATSVKRSDFQKVEFLLRHGRKQLKYLEMPGVGGASSFVAAAAPSSSSSASSGPRP
jgi:hypothetical protein